MMTNPKRLTRRFTLSLVVGLVMTAVLTFNLISRVAAQDEPEPVPTGSPLHPTFPLMDADGRNVLDSGQPISTMNTCGGCHDAGFIATHSFHADVGLSQMSAPGEAGTGVPWDTSPGLFGRWDPIIYEYLSPRNDERIDLTTPEWLMLYGFRHVGGGPAMTSRNGFPLTALAVSADNPETSIHDPETGELIPWDWNESGVVEMNCFLCHLTNPDNEARIAALSSGQFGWANTATLASTGIVEPATTSGTGWSYNPDAFDDAGHLLVDFIRIQDPKNENCGSCHGVVHTDLGVPLSIDGFTINDWSTRTTGQIISPQRLTSSGLNLENKETLDRTFDVHSERVLNCTDCHFALNNPVYYQESAETRPDHLTFDPRRLDLGEYLYRPLHQFAKGDSAQSSLAPELNSTLRRCEGCHTLENTHNWLPYKERHTIAMSCESCHIPEINAPALEMVDWTAITPDGDPLTSYRGIEGELDTANNLITGYQPVLLTRDDGDGQSMLAPYNLITSWYWIYGEPARPVRLQDLQAVWLDGESYHAEVLALFDANSDGVLSDLELRIDNEEKEGLISSRLAALGLENPRIAGETRPYSINHTVTNGEFATRDCAACHGDESKVTTALSLGDYTPGGGEPVLINAGNTVVTGQLLNSDNGALTFQPEVEQLYIIGHDNVTWIDWTGILLFLGTLGGVFLHGGLRYIALKRNPPVSHELREVYMYTVYERLWHWLQTAAILMLIFTGLIIHKPSMFGAFSFNYMVQAHNILGFILLVNAFLAAFYHFASGEIRQYLPQPHGFFNQMITQATFYVQGIFKGEEHPFEKTARRKLNPLQQVTYLAILNVLLPLQIITGVLIWGAQRWPEIAASLGGLAFLAPFHTLIAWLFATFIVMHVYLTTTGHTPLAGIKSMIMGWDEVEVHSGPSSAD